MSERAKREKQAKSDKFAEFRRVRGGGKRSYKVCTCINTEDVDVSSVIQVEDDAVIYDEVTEEQYKSIVRGRLAKDDFIVDDGVQGYTDNGTDDFEEREREAESDEEGSSSKGMCLPI